MEANSIERYRDDRITCAVIGLGYVGLPLAVTIAEAGLDVIGYDISERVVDDLVRGSSRTVDVSDARLSAALAAGFTVTSDPSVIGKADAVFICVPSPLGSHGQPDMTDIASAASTIGRYAHPDMLVSLESTTYPGTTNGVLVPALTAGGLRLDDDIFVAFSSERVSPGSGLELRQIPKVVGGVTEASTKVATAVYGRFIDTVHPVTTAEVAEFSKLLENTYRAVNIALMNELAQFANRIGVDIWETIEAAATKPFGFAPFYPGPGVGGHCIPLDPQYLAWRAREVGSSVSFIDTADRVNGDMARYVVQRAVELLNTYEKSVRGSRVLAVGMAYKRDVGDDRESAALRVLGELARIGASLDVIDPTFDDAHIADRGFKPASVPLGHFDLAIVLTDHTNVDYDAIADAATVVLDTRNVYRRRGSLPPNVKVL